MRLLKIKKDPKIKVSSSIVSILDNDFCYIPIYKNYNVLVKLNQPVLKNQAVMLNDLKQEITSPISGKVIGIEKVMTIDGFMNTIVIENDYKEKETSSKGIRKNLDVYKFSDLERIFNKYYVPELDGNLSSVSFSKTTKTLVINTINDEPYIANNEILLTNKIEELLDVIDSMTTVLNLDNTFIAVNNSETSLIEDIMKIIGTYPNINIKLIDNTYPLILENHFNNYDNIKIINIATLNAIDYVLKKEKNISEKLITITGDSISKKAVVLVKLGANLKEVIEEFLPKKNKKDLQIIANGLMRGKELKDLNLIVTPNLMSIHINEILTLEEKDCINCGACLKVCPIKNNPKFINDYPQNIMSISHKEQCINCNACSYVCPTNKNYKKILNKEDKNE